MDFHGGGRRGVSRLSTKKLARFMNDATRCSQDRRRRIRPDKISIMRAHFSQKQFGRLSGGLPGIVNDSQAIGVVHAEG